MFTIALAVFAVPTIPAMIAIFVKRNQAGNLEWYGDQLVSIAEDAYNQDLLTSSHCETRLIAIKRGNS
jgi:hypothetical protein